MIEREMISCEQYAPTIEEVYEKLFKELRRIIEIRPVAMGGYAARIQVMLTSNQRQELGLNE